MNILIADDSPSSLGMLYRTLVQGGHAVTRAEDGEEALERLACAEFDLIISDLNMAHLGGLELLLEVRATPRHMSTPFIFLTTEIDHDLKIAARKAGATGWMVKPFEPGPLLEMVARFDHQPTPTTASTTPGSSWGASP